MENNPRKPVRGTAEWAVAIVDCGIGCPHGCRYCYARSKLVDRLGLVSPAVWSTFRVDAEAVRRQYPLYPGQVMFPAHHDIVPSNLAASRLTSTARQAARLLGTISWWAGNMT